MLEEKEMVTLQCSKEGCGWKTPERNASLAAVLAAELSNHTAVAHAGPSVHSDNENLSKKCPAIERPKISAGGTEESWSVFLKKWDLFKSGSKIQPSQLNNHLFQCCDSSLGDDLLRGTSDIMKETEAALLAGIKRLAVQPVARGVRRTELMNMQQDSGEPIRSFYAKVKGRASTCSYVVHCKCTPPTKVDYTQLIVKDVLMNGLVDEDIKKEILGMDDLDNLEVEDMISRIESKETARNALNRINTSSAGISAFQKQTSLTAAEEKKLKMEIKCGDCDSKIKAYIRSRQGKLLERK